MRLYGGLFENVNPPTPVMKWPGVATTDTRFRVLCNDKANKSTTNRMKNGDCYDDDHNSLLGHVAANLFNRSIEIDELAIAPKHRNTIILILILENVLTPI